MSAIRELAIFSEGHREIMAHKRFGELLRAADNEYEEICDKLDALKHYADVDRERIATLQSRIKELERERDLAVAHDRQPYPTAWAYEQACKTIEKYKQQNEAMKKVVEQVREWRDWLGTPAQHEGDLKLIGVIKAYEQESA